MYIRAYNLVPGAAFSLSPDPSAPVYVVRTVEHILDMEVIALRNTFGTIFAFEFNDKVWLRGLSATQNQDDVDFGTDETFYVDDENKSYKGTLPF